MSELPPTRLTPGLFFEYRGIIVRAAEPARRGRYVLGFAAVFVTATAADGREVTAIFDPSATVTLREGFTPPAG